MRLALVLAAALAAVALAAGASSGAAGPALRLADGAPATVVGYRFHPSERVTVTLTTRARHVRTVAASSTGGFRVTFTKVALTSACSGWTVTARGDAGSRAAIVGKPLPDCAPPQPAGQ